MSIHSICAIVVTYNTGKNYIENFQAIYDQVDKIIIVDNGSNEETLQVLKFLKNSYQNVEIILNNNNLGLDKAQNIGINYAINLGFEWVLLLDDDSKAKHDMIYHMKSFYDNYAEQQKIGIIAPDIVNLPYYKKPYYATINNIFLEIPKKFVNQKFLEVYFTIASGSLMRTSLFRIIGEFRNDFFIDYVDVEYGLRIFLNGFKNIVVRAAVLCHRLGHRKEIRIGRFSIITSNHSFFRKYHIFRNRIKVWKLYLTTFPSFILYDMTTSIWFLIETLVFEKNRLINFKHIVKGIWHGFTQKVEVNLSKKFFNTENHRNKNV